ncbi:MAG: hypothetical protein EOO02_03110 [Chitinophagaceae bacterium]|nr:MAG: hypothetical protein EOO02_03110 [Chitinophagaceae bacterium]
MRITILLLSLISILTGAKTFAQHNYWQQQLSYEINVALDDKENELTGKMSLQYRNNSPDTLYYLWFHVWPNAFKNDRTAFSEERLRNGRTDFYFSKEKDRGYINQLDFRAENESLETEDDSVNIDVIKVILAAPLVPGEEVILKTPFHVKLPYTFSGSGHNKTQSYLASNWYPKVAVYDENGWHPSPYLEMISPYEEFADFKVSITLPRNYVVAATGDLEKADEIKWLKGRTKAPEREKLPVKKNKNSFGKPKVVYKEIASDPETKTINYSAKNSTSFVFAADKNFIVKYEEITVNANTVTVWAFYNTKKFCCDELSGFTAFLKAIRNAERTLPPLPYKNISLVEIKTGGNPFVFSGLIAEDGHHLTLPASHLLNRMFVGRLINFNEKDEPWLSLGLNEYLNRRSGEAFGERHHWNYELKTINDNLLNKAILQNQDQALNTGFDQLTTKNKKLVHAIKGAAWFARMRSLLSPVEFDNILSGFLNDRTLKHGTSNDLKLAFATTDNSDADVLISSIGKTGSLDSTVRKSKRRFELFYQPEKWDSVPKTYIAPSIGYNTSDGLMAGLMVHNYSLPFERFRYFVSPLYGLRSGEINGLADLGYAVYPGRKISSVRFGVGFAKFSSQSAKDSTGKRINAGFMKFTPSVRLGFRNSSVLSLVDKWLEWKTFIIGETGFNYSEGSDGQYYPSKSDIQYRYLNQLTFNITDTRILYPYDASLQVQQSSDFYRINLNAQYFFNYASGGGLDIRLFAAKFGYIGERSVAKEFRTYAFQPKLTAVRGNEDYTYSNYFIGRDQSSGLPSQQIMMRDGGLKIRTDLFQDLQGRSDNWVSSVNLSTSLPASVFPEQVPLKIFFDIGTYAGAWEQNSDVARFMYVGGLQLSLFNKILNIYAPVFYSKTFRDNLKTVPEENKFLRKISFSLDIHRLSARKSRFLNILM